MEDFEKLPRQTQMGVVLSQNILGRLLTNRISEMENMVFSRPLVTNSEESGVLDYSGGD